MNLSKVQEKWRGLSEREKMILTVAGSILILFFYFFLRVKPALSSLKELQSETFKIRSDIASLKIPEEPKQDLETLKQLEKEVREKIEKEKAKTLEEEERFVPLGDEKERTLALEISRTAREHDIRLLENSPYKHESSIIAKESPAFDALSQYTKGELYKRPLQKIVADTSFGNLRRFIDSLKDLSWRVTIVHLDIEKKSQTKDGEEMFETSVYPLHVTMVLAL